MTKYILTVLSVCLALSIASYFALSFYISHSNIVMSAHGHIAMALGIFFTYALGGGLMALLFYSNKHGHDESVHVASSDTHKTVTDTKNSEQ